MDHLPSPFSPFYTNPRTVILSERANARDAKDLLMRRLELSARGNDPPTRHVSTKDARHSEVRKWAGVLSCADSESNREPKD